MYIPNFNLLSELLFLLSQKEEIYKKIKNENFLYIQLPGYKLIKHFYVISIQVYNFIISRLQE
jgi:hypothetical protein